ncbi:alpha/beta fold hydrolase [Sphaerisporangium aureirubrum]|uniref:Alpha/beta fold hydrolase n=1 Tax=Sphaerisporangium aureirubrum TaxID=1544736 RepID=A0ABW1NSY7_9ACTN
MPKFSSYDGTELAYHLRGAGAPLVCLPGGPMRDSVYFGDLGGLSAYRRLVLLDLRGTGESAVPEDVGTYRCDRQVDDVEALRVHLGLERMDVLSHSGGGNLAVLYATRYPERVGRLVLVAPSVLAVGIAVTGEDRQEVARLRKDEPWYPEASAALEAVVSGSGTEDDWEGIAPFFYGRWDGAAREYHANDETQRNQEASVAYVADGAFDPEATRAALARYTAPVLLLAGEVDLNSVPRAVREFAGLFPNADLVVQAGAGHSPFLDDPERFATTVAGWLK